MREAHMSSQKTLPSPRRQAEEALFDTGAYIRCVYWKLPVLRAEDDIKRAERGAACVACKDSWKNGHY